MKLAAFIIRAEGRRTIGVFDGKNYVDLVALGDGAVPDSLVALLEQGDAGLDRVRALLGRPVPEEHQYAADAVELLPPIARPGKIIHTACNFDAHLDELTGWEAPEWQEHNWGDFHFEHPTGFLQAGNCVGGSGAPVSAPPFTRQLDYEIEVGIVIGKPAYQVSVEEAMDYVAGLAVFNDLSARDIQAREHANKVILLGKSFKG